MNELEGLIAQLGSELANPLPAPAIPVVEAEGESEDRMVRITVSEGKVREVVIDPRSMRKSSVELADDVRHALNAAVEAHAAALAEAMSAAATDPATLGTELDAIAGEATKSLGAYLDLMTEMMETAAARESR